jgi:sigma-B regulation protein RsbU (phosphoserine phosphatase)
MAEMNPGGFTPAPAMRDQLETRRRLLRSVPGLRDRGDVRALLSEVDAALARLDDGSFGACDRCHESIEVDRLNADPLIRFCLDCLTDKQSRALERDLELASAIQVRLLPPSNVRENGWEIGYRYLPAGPVSGDYCDVLPADDPSKPMHILLGDVSGKGVAASILMANLQAIFRSLIPLDLPLQLLVEQANRLFNGSTLPESYATIIVGRLHPTGSLEIVNAGHPAPVLVHEGEAAELPATGVPLGLFQDARYETRRFDLDNDDLLFLYSDGLSEARNSEDQLFGSRRVEAAVVSSGATGVEGVLGSCLDEMAEYCGGSRDDDVTLLAVSRVAR